MTNNNPEGSTPKHKRETTQFEHGWRWDSEAKHRHEAPPTVNVVVRDKIKEHGVERVVEILGLSRVTTLAIAAEAPVNISTMFVAQARLPELGRLDRKADDEAKAAGQKVAAQ